MVFFRSEKRLLGARGDFHAQRNMCANKNCIILRRRNNGEVIES